MTLNFGGGLFPPRRELIASFDFTEVLSNQGFVDFFIGDYLDKTATEENLLSSTAFRTINESITDIQALAITSQTDVTEFTEEFEAIINAPQTISGKGRIQLYRAITLGNVLGGVTTVTAHMEISLIRDRAGAETVIASLITPDTTRTSTDGDGTTADYETIELDCTKTRLNKDDILKVKAVWIWDVIESTDGSWTLRHTFGTDPEDRLKSAVNYNKPGGEGQLFQYAKAKQFKITIPFELIE